MEIKKTIIPKMPPIRSSAFELFLLKINNIPKDRIAENIGINFVIVPLNKKIIEDNISIVTKKDNIRKPE